MGAEELIREIANLMNNKDSLPKIVERVQEAFLRAGTDNFEDKVDRNNKGTYLKYKVYKKEDNKLQLTISFFNGQEEESMDVSTFDSMPLTILKFHLNNFYPEISFNYAKYDGADGVLKLYFQSSEPESFNDFKNQMDIEGIEVILGDETQELHSQHNNEDETQKPHSKLTDSDELDR